VRDAWEALWVSRLVVFAAGILGVLKFGIDPLVTPPPPTKPFGFFGNLVTAPSASFDAAFHLAIADTGYDEPARAAFFPLYALVVKAVGWVLGSPLLAGIGVSLAAFAVALYLIHRLAALELGEAYARPTVLLAALFPTALFFSAVYTEALFLALSVGSVLAARRGQWALAGAVGALAAATRNTGVLLLVPLVLLYLYGPREDAPPRTAAGRLRPGYPVRPDAAWLALVPAGLVAFLAHMATRGDALAPLNATREFWGRETAPLGAVWEGLGTGFDSVRQLVLGPESRVLELPTVQQAGQLADPSALAAANLTDLGFLAFAVLATVGVLRRLPLAYGAYTVAVLAVTLSAPAPFEPLASLPRYVVVLFPVFMWLALWTAERRRLPIALALSGGLLAVLSLQFATWKWVA